MTSQHNRRDFLKTTAQVGVGFWIAGSAAAQEKSASANEQIQFACIGVGGKGRSDSADAARHGQVVAICDIDERTPPPPMIPAFTDAQRLPHQGGFETRPYIIGRRHACDEWHVNNLAIDWSKFCH